MKKIYLLLLPFLCIGTFCFAQPVLIDDFSTIQSASVQLINEVDMNTQDGTGILGGERDVHLLKSFGSSLGSPSDTNFGPDFGVNFLNLDNGASQNSVLTVIYDGDDNDASLTPNAIGLGGVNVQTNGSAFLLDITNDQNMMITITIYSGAGNSSTIISNFSANVSRLSATFPFSGLVTASGTGADLTNVTAIKLEITGDANLDMDAISFRTNGTSVSNANNTPIPTMSQWGLFIFGLLMLNMGLIIVQELKSIW